MTYRARCERRKNVLTRRRAFMALRLMSMEEFEKNSEGIPRGTGPLPERIRMAVARTIQRVEQGATLMTTEDILAQATGPDSPSPPAGYIPLSPEARAELKAGLESARTRPMVYLGDFTQYAIEEDE